MPGIICLSCSVVAVVVWKIDEAHGVLAANGLSVPLFTCGGPLSSIDNWLNGSVLHEPQLCEILLLIPVHVGMGELFL